MASSTLKRCKSRQGDEESIPPNRKDAAQCPCRAVFRYVVRTKLSAEHHTELCHSVYPPQFTDAEEQRIAECPLASKLREIAETVTKTNGPAIDSLCAQLTFPEDPKRAKEAVAKVSRRVMTTDGWGRLIVLAVFSASVACRCADRKSEYVSIVLDDLEEFVDTRVHDCVEQLGKSSSGFSDFVNKWFPTSFKPQNALQVGMGVTAAVAAVAALGVLGKA